MERTRTTLHITQVCVCVCSTCKVTSDPSFLELCFSGTCTAFRIGKTQAAAGLAFCARTDLTCLAGQWNASYLLEEEAFGDTGSMRWWSCMYSGRYSHCDGSWNGQTVRSPFCSRQGQDQDPLLYPFGPIISTMWAREPTTSGLASAVFAIALSMVEHAFHDSFPFSQSFSFCSSVGFRDSKSPRSG